MATNVESSHPWTVRQWGTIACAAVAVLTMLALPGVGIAAAFAAMGLLVTRRGRVGIAEWIAAALILMVVLEVLGTSWTSVQLLPSKGPVRAPLPTDD